MQAEQDGGVKARRALVSVIRENLEGLGMGFDTMLLGECARLVRDNVQPDEVAQLPYIGLEHIEADTLRLNDHGQASDVTSTKLKFKKGDILFGKLRPYFRKVIRAPFDGVSSTDIWVVRAKPGIDQGFLYYLMASQKFVDFSMRGAEGTKMPRAKWEYVSRYEQIMFPLPEQRAIAHILGSLDDKIELNRRMNATLESIARALFKSWFVDFDPVHARRGERESTLPPEVLALFPDEFVESELGLIPRGWEVGITDDIITERKERNKDQEFENVLSVLSSGELVLSDNHFTKRVYSRDTSKYKKVYPFDFAYNPSRINIGSIGMLSDYESGIVSPIYVVFTPKNGFEWFLKFFICLPQTQAMITQLCSGSVRQSLKFKDFASLPLVLPPLNIIQEFTKQYLRLRQLVIANNEQSRTLAELRDMLLPRLISGELRVPENLGQD